MDVTAVRAGRKESLNMVVLQDTCAILMLLRIAPEMFTNPAFGCVTLASVQKEYVRKQEFKVKYPWRGDLAHHIQPYSDYQLKQKGFEKRKKQVNAASQAVRNPRTGHAYGYDLSPVDKEIAAALLTLEAELCSGDTNLVKFVSGELEIACHSPLAILNCWLEQKLVVWSEALHCVLTEWAAQEKRQPPNEIKRFEALTGQKYPAS